jgi:hypothetical protein
MPRIDLLQLRAGASSTWTSVNPVLALGEPGLETDTRRVKYGDGATAWNSLAYPDSGAVSPFKGLYVSEAALISAYPTADPGDYAYVDAGIGNPVEVWGWDDEDYVWVNTGNDGSTVPTADATTAGIMKLYVAVGANTDGTMTQAAISAALTAITVPAASETDAGKAELLTQAEANTGADDLRIATILKIKNRDGAVAALSDGGTVDITSDKWSLATSASSRTFTISHTGQEQNGVITLSGATLTCTFPSGTLCMGDLGATGNNIVAVTAVSGDKIFVSTFKLGSERYAVVRNFGQ